jgi:hypothetical protein
VPDPTAIRDVPPNPMASRNMFNARLDAAATKVAAEFRTWALANLPQPRVTTDENGFDLVDTSGCLTKEQFDFERDAWYWRRELAEKTKKAEAASRRYGAL